MKINRLLEITILLLNKEKVTAKELAERFEVSTRTIYRDIEILSMAGVPVYMSKGTGGGIALLEDYSINKALLSKGDKESLFLALKALESTNYPDSGQVLEKIGSIFNGSVVDEWIDIDLSSWGSNPNENDKISILKKAILEKKIINFDYVNAYADRNNRSVEPMKLIYKAKSWYLYAFCRLKNDFRIFKLSRIKNITLEKGVFEINRSIPDISEASKYSVDRNVTLKLRFKEAVLYRVFDDFDEESITKNSNGTYDVLMTFPEDEWVYGYLLSFGNFVEVLEPMHIREIIVNRMKDALKQYE